VFLLVVGEILGIFVRKDISRAGLFLVPVCIVLQYYSQLVLAGGVLFFVKLHRLIPTSVPQGSRIKMGGHCRVIILSTLYDLSRCSSVYLGVVYKYASFNGLCAV